jgi:hypothetical protein
LAGVIEIALPAGWSITGSSVNGLLSSAGATPTGYRWAILLGSGVTVQLTGPDTPGAVLNGTVSTLLGGQPLSIPLT